MSVNLFESISGLETVLNYHLQRHNVLVTNLAHAETPGYKPKDLVFAETLSSAAMVSPDGKHINVNHAAGEIIEIESEPVPGGNAVRMEEAMAQVSANRIRYETGIELIKRRVGLLRYAANDGGT